MWVTAEPLETEDAKEAMKKSVPNFSKYLKQGQIEIISYKDWYVKDGRFDCDRVLAGWVSKLEAALKNGYDGLRLTGNTFWLEKKDWKAFTDYEEAVNNVIGNYRMIAICTYSLDKCNANEIIDVVKNHQFALVKRSGKWELIEDADKKRIVEDLLATEKKFSALYNSMTEGVALHDVVYDDSGKAVDYVIMDVNPSFERIISLSKNQAIGKRASELYGTGKPPYLDVYAEVALSGKPTSFETYLPPMKKHFSISVISPSKGKFNTIFYDITDRRITEEALRASEQRWATTLTSIGDAVIATDVEGRITFMNHVAEKLTGWASAEASEKPLRKVFNIVNERTGKEVDDPVSKVLEKGLIIGLANHTLLICKDGTEIPIDDSGAPIRDENDKIIGVVLVFRNITERKRTENELHETRDYLEKLLNYANAPIIVWDTDFRITKFNRAFERLTGLGFGDAVGKNLDILFPADKKEQSMARIKRTLEGEYMETVEISIQHVDGTVKTLLWNSANISDSSGKEIVATIAQGHDITERKKAEEILLEHSLVFSSAMDAIFSTDNSFVIKSWNAAAERIFGWTAEEVIRRASTSIFNAVYPTLDGTTREEALGQLMNKGFWKGEIIYHKKDGAPIPVSASATLVKDKDNSVKGMVAVVHDITARKKREDVLREAQLDLNRAQAVAKTGSWRLDTRSNILVWSDETYRMFGVPKGTPLNYEVFLSAVHPEDRGYVNTKWNAALRGEPYDIEHRIIADGEVKWVHEKAELEFDENKTLIGGFGTAQDVTEQKVMQQKLEEAAIQLEEYANQMESLANERAEKLKDAERLAAIGATAGMVGHDIRNPLQSIIGEIYLAKDELITLPDGEAKQNLRESIDAIEKQTEYINKIVTDLQDFAKPLSPCIEEVNLETAIENVLSTLNVPSNIEVATSTETPLTLAADAAFIKRVVTNLLSNAIQAMPEGGKITITARHENGSTTLTVEDTGIGIPENTKAKLFQPLFTTKSKGQGFGLAVCKRLVEAMNGTITFESQEGKGTKFTVKLPTNNTANNK
jgi:PAS domain S-box-containing protein